MRYQTAAAFRRALEDRVRALAGTSDQQTMRLRKNVVFQRLLARLLAVSPDLWTLKGGLALDFRLSRRQGAHPRATKDMDLARAGTLEAADADFRSAQDVDLGDYFAFAAQRISLMQEGKEPGGAQLRYLVRAMLAGRDFEEVVVDVGFAPPSTTPDLVEGPDLLAFADLEPVRVPTLPTGLHVAEKLHAYTRHYGLEHAPSSRPKDLIDLVLLARHEAFLAGELWSALDEIFTTRGTHPLPTAVPPPPTNWARPYRELAEQVGISTALDDGHRLAGDFLDPILSRAAGGSARWDVSTLGWVPR